jgi:hypothetical protein
MFALDFAADDANSYLGSLVTDYAQNTTKSISELPRIHRAL